MAFTVRDLEDLIRLLDKHPAWMEALRQRMLTKDLLESPKTLRRLSTRVGKVEKALQALTESVAALTEAQRRGYEEFAAFRAEAERRFAELREDVAAARAEADRRFAELAEAQRRTEERVGRLEEAVAALTEAQRRHYEEFAAHRQEFLAYRAETDHRFAELREEVAAARAEADRRFAELAEAQRRHYEEFVAYRAETDHRFAELVEAQRRHYEEFAAFRAETERRFAELREEVAAARAEADRRFAALAEAQRRHYEEFAAHRQEFLAYRAETDRRFAELAEAQRRTEETVRELVETTQRMNRRLEHHAADLGELKTMRLEAFYHQRAAFAFHRLVRHASPISDEERYRILEQAAAAGWITREEAERALPLDLLVKGFHRREDRPVYLAVEISWLGGTEDVERAVERAQIFARALGEEVWPVVGAKELTPPARAMARQLGVWWVQDGQAFRPEEIPEEEAR